MYARGMTVREIQGHLLEIYGLEVSPDLISTVTDAVLETVVEWQNRPLEASYPLVFFDALRIKIRDEGLVRNKAVYIALGVQADGTKDILGHRTRKHRRGQILAARHERAEEPRHQRPSDCRCRRIEGLSRGDHRRLSSDHRSNLHHSSHPSFDGFRLLERPQVLAGVLKTIYRAKDAECGQGGARGFRREPVGAKISRHRAELAPELGAGDPVLRLSRGRPPDHLHHQRY
jgi:putative transposase